MILHGDSLHILKTLDENSVDSIVTDPPYGLKFMGKKWDYEVPSVELWREALRVLKPGGHLLSFGGTRTYHRMVVNIEDAGFEIRDCIQWLYGSGFPKSHNVSKSIDKEAGAERENLAPKKHTSQDTRGNPISKTGGRGTGLGQEKERLQLFETAPATPEAKQWDGWGTALKPANEPIVMARKPIEGTVAQNVLRWGTGCINIDASRIQGAKRSPEFKNPKSELGYHGGSANSNLVDWDNSQGRWPANIILDEEAAAALDEQSGNIKGSKATGLTPTKARSNMNASIAGINRTGYDDSGGASRFFYVAKASQQERFSYLTCNCETVNPSLWKKQDLNQNEPMDTTSPQKDICEKLLDENSNLDTSLNGSDSTDPSLIECKSITSTITQQTTTSQTCNLSHQQSISESIQGANLETASGLSHAKSAKKKSQSTHTIGTYHVKDGRSMGVAVHATLAKSLSTSVCAGCGESPRAEGHPTQKPVKLMEYLIRLITPQNGTVLDPFAGSGSTGVACKSLGFEFVGIELNKEYVEIAERRIDAGPLFYNG